MPSRIYFPSVSTTATISVNFATWAVTTSAIRVYGTTASHSGSAFVAVTATEVSAAGNQLLRQFIFLATSGIATGVISGTVKGIIGCLAGNNAVLAGSQMNIRVVSRDGTVTRGTLYSFENATATVNWATATTSSPGRNAKFPKGWTATAGDTMTAVTVTATSDLIVVEVGPRVGVGGEANTSMYFGNPSASASDRSEDETGVVANRPWLEFSGDIFPGATSTATATGTAETTLRTLAATGVGLAFAGAVVLPNIPVWNRQVKRWAA